MVAGKAQKWFGWLPICGGKVEMEEIFMFGFQSLENLWYILHLLSCHTFGRTGTKRGSGMTLKTRRYNANVVKRLIPVCTVRV